MTFRFPTQIIARLGLVTAALGQAVEPAKPLVATTPRVPAIGIELDQNVRTQLREQTDALGQAEWQALKTIQAANKAQATQIIDSAWPSRGNRFYRLLLKPRE